MCELKSKTDRGSSSMSEIAAKRVGLFSSGEKKIPNQIRLTNISPRHLDQGDQGLLQSSQAAWPWMARHVLSISMQPTDSSSTAEFGSMKGCHHRDFFYNSLQSIPPMPQKRTARFITTTSLWTLKRYVKISRYVKNDLGLTKKLSGHGGHQSKRKTLEMPDELCLSDIAGRPACACRWQGTYTRLVRLKGYKASAYCKQAADTLHAIIPQYWILLCILKVLNIVRQLQYLLHLKENEEYINPVGWWQRWCWLRTLLCCCRTPQIRSPQGRNVIVDETTGR